MKKAIAVLVAVLAMAAVVVADTIQWTSSAMLTNTQNETSSALPVSGYIDSIEICGNVAAATGTVVVSTYIDGHAAQTLATVTASGITPSVVRPRIVGTTTAGVAITAAATTTNSTSTMLIAPLEKILSGGDIKAYCVGTVASSNRFNVKIIFEPVQH